MGSSLGPTNEMGPFLNQGPPGLVRWMGFASQDELHRALRMGQQTKQSLWIVQQEVRPFIGREAPRKAKRQHMGIK